MEIILCLMEVNIIKRISNFGIRLSRFSNNRREDRSNYDGPGGKSFREGSSCLLDPNNQPTIGIDLQRGVAEFQRDQRGSPNWNT